MGQLPYDIKLNGLIKSVRELMAVKQITVADALSMTRSNYSKIECSERKITPAQLSIIAKAIKTTASQLHFLADEELPSYTLISLADVIRKLILKSEGKEINFTDAEFEFIKKIKETFDVKKHPEDRA